MISIPKAGLLIIQMVLSMIKLLTTCFLMILFFNGVVLAAPPLSSPRKGGKIDLNKEGEYSSGDWRYTHAITNPGSRSQGTVGRLFYKDNPVPSPADPADYYETPLGLFHFNGFDEVPWGERGWTLYLQDDSLPREGESLPWPDGQGVVSVKQHMRTLISTLTSEGAESSCFDEVNGFVLQDTDPWGSPYRALIDFRGGEGGGLVNRLVLTSAGQDKIFGTKDDLESSSRFFPVAGAALDLEAEMPTE